MSRMGRAVVAHGQDFDIREYPVPDPEPHGILLRQELAGICGTDLHGWQKGIPGEKLLGHENVGVIEAIGSEVKTDYVGNPLREGDRVILAPTTPHGIYGYQDNPDDAPHFRGGFTDYINLVYPDSCYIKTSLPPEIGVLTEPFTIGVHAAMRARVEIGDTVIVQGSGAIGLLTLVCAKISGAAKIIAIGGPPERLALARRLGADVTFDIEDLPELEERKELVLAQTPHKAGAEVVFECAGFLPAVPEGLSYVKQNGVFCEVGHFVDIGSVSINPNQHLLRKNLRLEGIFASGYEHFVRGLPILERNEFPYADMVSHVLPLERVCDGFEALDGTYQLDGRTAIKIAVGGGV